MHALFYFLVCHPLKKHNPNNLENIFLPIIWDFNLLIKDMVKKKLTTNETSMQKLNKNVMLMKCVLKKY